jgi:hypothetical protein
MISTPCHGGRAFISGKFISSGISSRSMPISASSFVAVNEEAQIGIKREEIPEDINFPDIKAEITNGIHLVMVEEPLYQENLYLEESPLI